MRGYLGLGSNEGDRLANLRAAHDALGEMVVRSSSVYETEPQGEVRDQREFLNAVVEIETELRPDELLALCKRIERQLGQAPGGVRHGPRPIDVDLLLLDDLEIRSDEVTLPHPGLAERRFVLEPLVELDPDLCLPDGTRLANALDAVADQRVARVGEL